jgi:micrococcal nuclease
MKRKQSKRGALAGVIILAALGALAWIVTGRAPFPLGTGGGGARASAPGRATAEAGAFEGEVVGVLDGDTLDVLRDGRAVRVRLAEIDCPEKKQAFGQRAKQRASELAFGKSVRVETTTVDRYGRSVARVRLPDGRSLNEALLRDGLAWWYRQYSKDARLGALEEEARGAKRGLWAAPSPTPPWEFRKERRR